VLFGIILQYYELLKMSCLVDWASYFQIESFLNSELLGKKIDMKYLSTSRLLALVLAISTSFSVLDLSSAANDYCVAIRGNGQNAIAHWPALGRMVEELGLPKVAAGGSSATVSMFFLEAVAANPRAVAEFDINKRNAMQGMLLKSLQGYVQTMAAEHHWNDVFQLSRELFNKSSSLSEAIRKFSVSANSTPEQLANLFSTYQLLLNNEILRLMATDPVRGKAVVAEAAQVFGSFDAKKDINLFFRPGLIDFKSFALMLGQIADFYSGHTNANAVAELNQFLDSCALLSKGKYWLDMSNQCREQFSRAVRSHLSQPAASFQNYSVFEKLGRNIDVFPTTGVVNSQAKKRYEIARAEYIKGNESNVAGFRFDFASELEFGYWGRGARSLEVGDRVKQMFRGDLKSAKFRALGEASWFDVLSTSPAEPGLTNFQEIPKYTNRSVTLREQSGGFKNRWRGLTYRNDYLSVGGWSDLHPTLVLRAAGCDNVVYLQRQGGDAVFGQQLFIRMTGTTAEIPFWDHISDNNDLGWNVSGSAAENTPWNQLYNLGNPSSSYRRSILEANAVYCTNWNAYEPLAGQSEAMALDSHNSKVLVRSLSDSRFAINGYGFDPVQKGYSGCR
jgi:hypothetical protein